MASVDDLDELIATRRLNGLEDNLFKVNKKMKLKDILYMEEYLKENKSCIGIYNKQGRIQGIQKLNTIEK